MKKNFYSEIIELIKKDKPSKLKLANLKIKLCRKHGLKNIPIDIDILLNAPAKDIPKIKPYLLTKPTRTISGVAVVAIMTRPLACPHAKTIGPCIMCPGGPESSFGNVPQSYTGKEPATRRALRNRFDPYLQVMNRLEQYIVSGHVPDKIELIIMGGTFPSFKKSYREDFVKYALKAMNDFSELFFDNSSFNIKNFKKLFELPGSINDKRRESSIRKRLLSIKKVQLDKSIIKKIFNEDYKKIKKDNISLYEEQTKNEDSIIRCVGLTIETRPDYAKLKHGNEMLRLGATRIELGIQTIHDNVLRKIRRGHSVFDSIKATRTLKDLGFKINYHMMPGLPDSDKESDLNMLKQLFTDDNFKPDMLKLYPCMVLKGTKLYDLYKKKKFIPISTTKAASLIAELKKSVPEYVRIMRVQRDIPTFMTESGVDKTNLRQYVDNVMKEKGIKCRCIRCREIKDSKISGLKLKTTRYSASEGKEFFISAESCDKIAGYLRLRFPSKYLREEIKKSSAIVRELHVLGPAVSVGKKGSVQHLGIGKKLLKKAEEISIKNNKDKIIIISGIGARNYYKKLGYNKEGPYMTKNL